jgi:hypothetical protein
MRSVSTFAQRSAMAPEDRKDRMEMSEDCSPTVWPITSTVRRRSFVRVDVLMASHEDEKYAYNNVVGGALKWRKCLTRLIHACTGQNVGLPERLRPINSPRTPFFWLVNSRQTKVAESRDGRAHHKWAKRCGPACRWTSQRRNGIDSALSVCAYSPGHRRK